MAGGFPNPTMGNDSAEDKAKEAPGGPVVQGTLTVTGGTTGTVAPGAGGAGALPATPAGYLTVNINGTARQIPYY